MSSRCKRSHTSSDGTASGSQARTPVVIDLTLDDDEEEKAPSTIMQSAVPLRRRHKKIKSEPGSAAIVPDTTPSLATPPGVFDLADDDDDDVEVIDPQTLFTSNSDAQLDQDEDLRVVGSRNHVDLIHMRQHCTQFSFQASFTPSPAITYANSQCCEKCYCYVCDSPASECDKWEEHCHATDSGSRAAHWKHQRALVKAAKDGLPPPAAPTGYAYSPWLMNPSPAMPPANHSYHRGPGPLSPQTTPSPMNWTQCRYCKWYTQLQETTLRFGSSAGKGDPIIFSQWCLACGRVASDQVGNGIPPEQRFKPNKAGLDVSLGTKQIPFRLHAHDPRSMAAFQSRWQAYGSEWTPYSADQMRQDLFCHRVTAHPDVRELVHLQSPFSETNIPKDGTVNQSSYSNSRTVGAVECDAIVFEESTDALLLQKIADCSKSPSSPIKYLLSATWDATTSRGNLVLETFVPDSAMEKANSGDNDLALFLGLWFGYFPTAFSELSGACKPQKVRKESITGVSPYSTLWWNVNEGDAAVKERALKAWLQWKKGHAVDDHMPKISLTPSVNGLGGICPSGHGSLEAVLKSYFTESLVDDFSADDPSIRLLQHVAGLHSQHRDVWQPGCNPAVRKASDDVYLLGEKEGILHHLRYNGSKVVKKKITSLTTLLAHAENLGHDLHDPVEGLEVELLPFQLQTLKWALERERIRGGVQSLHWAKVPLAPNATYELYFNPLLGMFSKTRPEDVRGGWICESMGLGKTIISLALILSNPAPALPVSGARATDLSKAPKVVNGHAFWKPPNPASSGEGTPIKRGKYLSRATLVVCQVSLVGQWIEEAKAKLTDPGLVYAYHGANRKRDPKLLAKNAIVVTTYETLASDATYHAQKSNSSSYCPPMEQIRWWRVIVDECHVLRSNSGKAEAVKSIEADHKWLVSGTPVSTSLDDVSNQLAFLGIKHSRSIVTAFKNAFGSRVGCAPSTGRRRRSRYHHAGDEARFGRFAWFMRSIMARHTQEMKYESTTTTLMSLPPKEETVLEISFTAKDKKEYLKIEGKAQTFYRRFNPALASKSYLRLTSKLLPLRVACAGGQVPVDESDQPKVDQDDSDEETVQQKHKLQDYVFKSKLDRLVVEMESIRDDDPSAKTLIFSQFNSTLEWLQRELPRHGFQFRTLSGDMTMSKRAKALRDFQNDPPTTVFLLSMRAGAVGINLTAANRVFLLEPCFNPSLEAQAIGRVWRLGQKRGVKIYRMIMKDSVEERMQKMLKEKYGNKDGPETAVGSLKTDKAKMVAKEFDLLFGVDRTEEQSPPPSDQAVVPDAPPSSNALFD